MCSEKFPQADLPGETAKTRRTLRKTHTDIQDTVCSGGCHEGKCWMLDWNLSRDTGISEYLFTSYLIWHMSRWKVMVVDGSLAARKKLENSSNVAMFPLLSFFSSFFVCFFVCLHVCFFVFLHISKCSGEKGQGQQAAWKQGQSLQHSPVEGRMEREIWYFLLRHVLSYPIYTRYIWSYIYIYV